jgi:hypothetical protein
VPECIKWGEERHQECSQTADQGYNECSAYQSRCCDWWPCSWACQIVSWLCVAWTWVSNVVCVAWTWITTAVCVVWDVVTTIVGAVIVTLESTIGWFLNAFALIIEALELIPGLGTLIRWVINFVTSVFWIVVSIGDAVAGAVGIRPEKKLRVCPIILTDERGRQVMSTPQAVQLLQVACDVYKRDANVRIVPLRPFKYTTGFTGGEMVDSSWIQVTAPPSSSILDVPCEAAGAAADWGLVGTHFQTLSTSNCAFGTWRRVLGYGAPVTVVFIRGIPGALGCALWITDYVTIASNALPDSPRTVGHEIGHASNLWHTCVTDDVNGIMATGGACSPASSTPPDRINPDMEGWQVLLVRASKHATYF